MSFPYKYDTHVHSNPASACAVTQPEEIVELYAKAGYAGFFLTDHFFNGNCGIPWNLPWTERVRRFADCYHRARRRGGQIGFNVFFGYEFANHGAEFLILNSNEQFLLDHPDLLDWPLEDFLDRIRASGAFVVHAHPCRVASYINNPNRIHPDHVDAVEVYNAAHNPVFNPPAEAYAAKHNLIRFSGSDNHNAYDILPAGLAFRTNPGNADEFVFLVKSGEYELIK